jgi:hypothetical protein
LDSISADRVQAEAEARVGMSDPERDQFAPNLAAIVESANAEGRLSPTGLARTHGELVGALANKLETLRWIGQHPDIQHETIERPILLTGLPRSGTTYFLYLFDRDPALRLLRSWEAARPCPPPAAYPDTIAPRIAASQAISDAMRASVPGADAIHLSDPDGPEECHSILTQTFAQAGFYNYLRVPSYFDYLLDHADLAATYRVHKRQLQLLQWRAPARRWTLKYPNHLLGLRSIVEVYPDAQFLITHRDPVQTLASLCKLTLTFRAMNTQASDPHEIGRQMRYFVRRHIDRLMAFEAETSAAKAERARMVHVDYYRLVDAPEVVLSEIYPKIGVDMSPAVRRDIAEWRARNPKGKRGVHRYGLDEFGLSAGEVAEEFAFYTRYFDIPREAAAA